jgi:hypothetical protein
MSTAWLTNLAITSDSKFMYVIQITKDNRYGDVATILAFSIDSATGKLTTLPFTLPTSADLVSLVADSSGFLFATDYGGNTRNLWMLAIDALTGNLTPVSGSPFSAGSFPTAIAVASTKFSNVPVLTNVSVMPIGIATNEPSVITVLAKISDPSVIPTSVNLLRLNGTGTTIIGNLRDDGQGGDLVAGDQVYTGQVSVTELAAGQIQLQVSAAFKGVLRRAISGTTNVNVATAVGLPPDPGVNGLMSIQGIDSDGDGVRDDVQRYVALSYPSSAKARASLTQVTTAVQALLMGANGPGSIANMVSLGHALECSAAINGPQLAIQMYAALRAQILNTLPRLQAFYAADAQFSGQTYALTPQGQQATLCAFNPAGMPN